MRGTLDAVGVMRNLHSCLLLNIVGFIFCRTAGRWGPDLGSNYRNTRFGSMSAGTTLSEEESDLTSGLLWIM
jgi:hypothetical protein